VDDAPAPDDEVRPTLRQLLADDIAAGRVAVFDRPLGQTVMIKGDGLFPSARTEVRPPFVPLLDRVGTALSQLPGNVLITGHTDSVPIRTLRFPSNQVLSQARAESVRDLLAQRMGGSERLMADGRGATEPLASLEPADPRNRRVEITLIRGASNPVQAD
jgi:type VI secretion system protein ImpK